MFWGLFNSKPPKPQIPKRVILDNGETFDIDDDYAALGEAEGWLIFTGYHRIGGVLYFTYKHTA